MASGHVESPNFVKVGSGNKQQKIKSAFQQELSPQIFALGLEFGTAPHCSRKRQVSK